MARLVDIREQTLRELVRLNGSAWEDVRGELHLHYDEMPTWIVLGEDHDLDAAHRAFVDVIRPYLAEMGRVNFTVSYDQSGKGGSGGHAFFDTNDEILRALTTDDDGAA